MWGVPSMVPPLISNFVYQSDQAPSASQGKQKTPTPSKNSALTEPKKRKVAEVALVSQPKAGSATALSRLVKASKRDPLTQAVQFQTAEKIKSFVRLSRKVQLYQAAMDRFCRSLVYHNRRFCKNIQESDLIDLVDKSEEVEMSVALNQKQRTCQRRNKRKAMCLADKSSKPTEEPEATLDQAVARDSQSSTLVSSTPFSLVTDAEMTPVVALPIVELKKAKFITC